MPFDRDDLTNRICEHLRPALEYVVSLGLVPKEQKSWGTTKLLVTFDTTMDVFEVKQHVSLDPCVMVYKQRSSYDWDQGLACQVHEHVIVWPLPEPTQGAK